MKVATIFLIAHIADLNGCPYSLYGYVDKMFSMFRLVQWHLTFNLDWPWWRSCDSGLVTAGAGRLIVIFVNHLLLTVCSDESNYITSDRQIGYVCSGLARALTGSSSMFTPVPATLPVWLRAVQCDGSEGNIASCPFQLNRNACSHGQDAGVLCLGSAVTTTASTAMKVTPTTLPPKICNV